MKNVVPLILTAIVCTLPLPLVAQEDAREALRGLTEEYDDRVLAHLLALLPHARDAAAYEATVEYWVADLDPADTVNVRHRIDELLREVPEQDLYGLLLALVQFRHHALAVDGGSEDVLPEVASAARLGGPHTNPYPKPPVDVLEGIGRLGSQLEAARGNCSELRRLWREILHSRSRLRACCSSSISPYHGLWVAYTLVLERASELLRESNC